MSFPSELIRSNNDSRERLRALLERLTDDQYSISLDADWTVGTALAHVAIFDQRALDIIATWERDGVAPSPLDVHIFNLAILPFLRELSPKSISKLTLETAERLDAKLATLSDTLLDQYETTGDSPFALNRAQHRNEHIDQIESAL